MTKKYAPFIVLLMAALLLFYVKRNQRGATKQERIEVPAVVPGAAATEGAVAEEAVAPGDVNRHPAKIIYTKHAKCRMECRHITEAEVKEILENGKLKSDKINQDQWGTTYPIDGKTSGDKMVRIVVSPKKSDLVLVTVIDLDTDWPCECK